MRAVLEANEFKRIIDNTKKFTANASEATLMQWIHLVIDAETKEIKAEALDGHRMSVEYARLKEADVSFDCLIKPNIPKITKNDREAELILEDNRLYVTVTDMRIGYTQPQGKYYKTNELIKNANKESNNRFGINAKYLVDAMQSIDINSFDRKIAVVDIYEEHEPIVIRSGRRGEKQNLKIILPVIIRD